MRDGQDGREDEKSALDSFWDIGSLLPRQKTPTPHSVRRDTSAVELPLSPTPQGTTGSGFSTDPGIPGRGTLPAGGAVRERAARPEAVSEVLFRYEPEGSLIRAVTVSSWPYSYNFYDRFLADADRLFGEEGRECDFVPFFSYIPQYLQLSPRQLAFYLWWRDCARRGRFLKTDLSYVLLLIYEIINLPERVPAEQGLGLLTDLWLAYRQDFSALDKYLCEWLCDYCLIHRLPPPLDRLDPVLNKITERASFREFYLAGARDESENGAAALSRALVRFASSYNWRASRALTPENRPLFRRYVPGAVGYLLEHAGESALAGAKPVLRTLSRDAYAASLCSCNAKRRLDIEYLSFDHSIELRAVVTAAVKYAENRIRAATGVKSRLKVPPLPEELLRPLCEYFDRELPLPARTHGEPLRPAAPARPDYEKLYDSPAEGFDAGRAREIEQASWRVTRMLEETLAEDTEREPETPAAPAPPSESPESAPCSEKTSDCGGTGWAAFFAALNGAELTFLRALRRGESAADAARAAGNGALPDALADAVNEAAAQATGDILLEETEDGGYAVIDEYWEEAAPFENDGAQ